MVDFNMVTIIWIGSQSILLNRALGDQLNWLTHKLTTWTFFTATLEIDLIFISTVLKTVNWHNTVNHGSHYFSKPILGSNYLKISILKGFLIKLASITHISYFGLKCSLTEICFYCLLVFLSPRADLFMKKLYLYDYLITLLWWNIIKYDSNHWPYKKCDQPT